MCATYYTSKVQEDYILVFIGSWFTESIYRIDPRETGNITTNTIKWNNMFAKFLSTPLPDRCVYWIGNIFNRIKNHLILFLAPHCFLFFIKFILWLFNVTFFNFVILKLISNIRRTILLKTEQKKKYCLGLLNLYRRIRRHIFSSEGLPIIYML